MRSKKLLATLIVALMLSSTGCGFSSTSENSSEIVEPEESSEIVEPEEISNLDTSRTSRFSAKKVKIPGLILKEDSFIITDHETGKQYLYITGQYCGGIGMMELGSVDENSN